MRIGTTDYWHIKTKEDWQEALDANAYEECIFSDAVPGREALWGEYEGAGIYYIHRFLHNPCEYGIMSSLLDQEDVRCFLEEAQAMAAVARLWQQLAEEAE